MAQDKTDGKPTDLGVLDDGELELGEDLDGLEDEETDELAAEQDGDDNVDRGVLNNSPENVEAALRRPRRRTGVNVPRVPFPWEPPPMRP